MHADAVSAWAASVQAGLLLVAAGIARRQVSEAKRLRKAQAQPYVVVSFEADPEVRWMSRIVITNMGSTVAKDVAIDFDPPLVSTMEAEGRGPGISQWKALTDGIPTLAPGQSLSTLFDSLLARYSDDNLRNLPRETTATVTYSDKFKESYEDTYILDFHIYYNSHFAGRKGIEEAVKGIEEIAKALRSWTETDGIRVYTKDLERYLADQRSYFEELIRRHSVKPTIEVSEAGTGVSEPSSEGTGKPEARETEPIVSPEAEGQSNST